MGKTVRKYAQSTYMENCVYRDVTANQMKTAIEYTDAYQVL